MNHNGCCARIFFSKTSLSAALLFHSMLYRARLTDHHAAMKKQTRNRLLFAAALVALCLFIYFYWMTKDTVKIAFTGLTVSTGTVLLTHAYSGKSDPTSWAGKKITIHTKSLGTIKTTVASATATALTTATGAYTGSATYATSPKDYARIILKY